MNQIVLTGLLPSEICEQLELPQKFRGTQIFKWIGSGVTDFDAMTNLSAELRSKLKKKALLRSSTVSNVLKDPDGTIKLQISLHDGNAVESKLLPQT